MALSSAERDPQLRLVMLGARDNLLVALAALAPELDQSAETVRLTALAWLVCCGLRQTACCLDLGAVPAVEKALGGAVEFEVRGLDSDRTGLDRYWLSDAVVLYAAGTRGALAPAWAEHRRAYSRGVELGRALGYFAPRELPPHEEALREIDLHHYAALPGGAPIGLWAEKLPPETMSGAPGLAAHLHALGLALREIGLAYTFKLKKPQYGEAPVPH